MLRIIDEYYLPSDNFRFSFTVFIRNLFLTYRSFDFGSEFQYHIHFKDIRYATSVRHHDEEREYMHMSHFLVF